jgi:3-methyladenine DNA glycosylase AlkC
MIGKTKQFSLKDQLFNPQKVEYLSKLIKSIYLDFDDMGFHKDIIEKFPLLELKERIFCIREYLKKYLPKGYKLAVNILLNALPKPLDPNKTDNDFGDFIFAPFSDFIAIYGCDKNNLSFSLKALERITQNFSAEDSIRFFLDKFPKETLEKVKSWSVSENYHVRRLATEGTRPSLPWSKKLNLDNNWVINNILENLFYDKTRYVVRSVANHLNDISKINSNLVIETLVKWKKSKKQNLKKELDYLVFS